MDLIAIKKLDKDNNGEHYEERKFMNLLEKIDVAKERIKELGTMINHWEGIEVEGFCDARCYINTSSPGCLLFND